MALRQAILDCGHALPAVQSKGSLFPASHAHLGRGRESALDRDAGTCRLRASLGVRSGRARPRHDHKRQHRRRNTIVEGTSSGVLTGTFEAGFSESFRDVVHLDGSVDISATVSLQGQTPCGSGRWTQSVVVHVAPDGSFAGQTAAIDAGSATVAVQTEFLFRGAGNTFTYVGSYSCV